MMFIYNLIPKWLLMILVALLLAAGIYIGIKMEYYKVDNARLTNDNKILTDNVAVLTASLDTCTKSLAAEAENCKRQGRITVDTGKTGKEIEKICVKEKPGEKTDVTDAVAESNRLSDRFNGVLPASKSN
jgi:hypothetical protein